MNYEFLQAQTPTWAFTEERKPMPEQPPQPSWIERMASDLSDGEPSRERVKLALEAAVEMRCARYKIALARCWEVLTTAKIRGQPPLMEEGFCDEIFDLTR